MDLDELMRTIEDHKDYQTGGTNQNDDSESDTDSKIEP